MPAAESRMQAHPAHANVMRAGRPCRTTIGGVGVRRRSAQVRDRARRPGPGRLRGLGARRCRAETSRAYPGGRGRAVARPHPPPPASPDRTRALLRLRGSRPIPVMVRFDVDPIASYAGGIPGLRATSPGVAGTLRLGSNRVRVVPPVPDEQDDLDRGFDPSNGPGGPAPADLRRRVRRRLDAGSGGARARCPAGPGRRGGPAGPSGPHAHDHHPALPGRRPGLADPGRSGSGGEERGHRGAGLGHLARTSIVQGPRASARSPAPPGASSATAPTPTWGNRSPATAS